VQHCGIGCILGKRGILRIKEEKEEKEAEWVARLSEFIKFFAHLFTDIQGGMSPDYHAPRFGTK
jgi:hypothetical protein